MVDFSRAQLSIFFLHHVVGYRLNLCFYLVCMKRESGTQSSPMGYNLSILWVLPGNSSRYLIMRLKDLLGGDEASIFNLL